MPSDHRHHEAPESSDFIHLSDSGPPIAVPPQYVGPVMLPGTGRMVYWTGRVAIGLRHVAPRRHDLLSQSSLWLQDLMLSTRRSAQAA